MVLGDLELREKLSCDLFCALTSKSNPIPFPPRVRRGPVLQRSTLASPCKSLEASLQPRLRSPLGLPAFSTESRRLLQGQRNGEARSREEMSAKASLLKSLLCAQKPLHPAASRAARGPRSISPRVRARYLRHSGGRTRSRLSPRARGHEPLLPEARRDPTGPLSSSSSPGSLPTPAGVALPPPPQILGTRAPRQGHP